MREWGDKLATHRTVSVQCSADYPLSALEEVEGEREVEKWTSQVPLLHALTPLLRTWRSLTERAHAIA